MSARAEALADGTAPPVFLAWLEAGQTECPVVPRLTAAELAPLGRAGAERRAQEREEAVANMTLFPLTHCWEPDIWRRIDLLVARKRIAHPGRVLEVFITGGMRPGKSFSCARRMVAHWLYTERACVFALADTQATSRPLQQQPIEAFLPEEVSPASGKHKATKHDRYKFSGGHFTNDEFSLRVPVQDETGRRFMGGGDFKFRFFNQELSTFQGFAVSAAWSDELVPLDRVKTLFERMGTRAQETRAADHAYRMRRAVDILESGRRLPVELLGALYHGVHLVSFTPYLGWNETVNYFLAGAEKLEHETAPELAGRPGVTDPRVPRFAQPVRQTALVAYIHTRDNLIKPDTNLLEEMRDPNRSEDEIRLKLYGDVSRGQSVLFGPSFDESLHVVPFEKVPRDVTIWEVLDPGAAKPYVFLWVGADVAGRLHVLQEWPCPQIPIDGCLPGMWAVPSETDRLNGDEGPAQKLRLRWGPGRWVGLVWEMRQRLMRRFAESGGKFAGRIETVDLSVKDGAFPWEVKGEVALPFDNIMDSRFAKAQTVVGDETVDLQVALEQAEHGIYFQAASGANDEVGNTQILCALNERRLGLPGLMVVDECENTRFMLRTYSLPQHSETTKRKDEACVDYRDALAYAVLAGPRFVNRARWQNRPDQRWD